MDFKVDTYLLDSDAEVVKERVDSINKRLGNLTQYLTELDAMWDGPASEAFKERYKEDLVALMTMVSNLQNIYTFENSAKERYENCEHQVADVISDI